MQAMLDEQADLLAAMQASMADGSILPMVQASMGDGSISHNVKTKRNKPTHKQPWEYPLRPSQAVPGGQGYHTAAVAKHTWACSVLPKESISMLEKGTNYSFGGVGYSFSAGASGTASGARRKAVTRLRVTDLAVIAELNPFHKSPIALVGGSPGDQD